MTPARAREVLDAVAPGRRVLVRTTDGVLVGRFLDATPTHVRLTLRVGEARVPLASIETIEIAPSDEPGKWRGRYSRTATHKGDDHE